MTSVSLRPFTGEEFEPWREQQVLGFADALGSAEGRPASELVEASRQIFDRLMPDALATPHTWVLHVVDEQGEDVGLLWLGPHRQRSDALYVYDVEIGVGHRGRGLGRAAMLVAERIAREAGYVALGLNVFADNEGARALYDSLGYQVVSTQMSKPIGGLR